MSTSVKRRTVPFGATTNGLDFPSYVPHHLAGALLAAGDVMLAVLAFASGDLAFHSLPGTGAPQPVQAALLGAFAGLITVAAVAAARGYTPAALARSGGSASGRSALGRSAASFLLAWLAAFLTIGVLAVLTRATVEDLRGGVSLAFAIGVAGALPLRHAALAAFQRQIRTMRLATRRVVVVHDGDERAARRFQRSLRRSGVDAVATLTDRAARDGALVEACRDALAARDLDAVYVYARSGNTPRLRDLRAQLRKLPLPVYLFPDDAAAEALRHPRIDAGFAVGYEVQRAPLDTLDRLCKRTLDVCVSGTMLCLLAPLLACVALAVRLDSPGPALFRQTRRGYSGRPFKILKFRSMRCAEDGAVVRQACREDDRTTPIGRFLRASSIDELPQLLNVLRGDMSLVGPRPHAIAHDAFYSGQIEAYADRHHVKPGLTGWAQVNGHRGATPAIEDMQTRVTHDLWYIDNWSLRLDLAILLRTALVVLRDRNAY